MRLITKFTRRSVIAAAAALTLSGFATSAMAAWPEKPIEFIIPFGAGGSADIEGRLLADEMGKILGVPVVPVNKPGGGGAVTYTHVKNAKPDGYTVAWSSTSILTSTNIGNVPFKHDALDHLGQVEFQPMPFSVKGDAPWKTLQEFADYCKANPGKIKIANSGTGSATHIASLAMVNAMGCEVIHLPVGVKRRNATVLSGEAHAQNGPLTASLNLSRAGKLRLLAVPSSKRNPVIPDVPTAKELGFDAEVDLFRSLSVPKGTPADIKQKLADVMVQAANSKPFLALASKKGFTVEPLTLKDFDEMLQAEDAKVVSIMKKAGLYQSKAKK
ncbi:MAG: tripartite tricarboxylate transporter substrate binding protein [Candidatus Sedimenticola sp. PURPLELP]